MKAKEVNNTGNMFITDLHVRRKIYQKPKKKNTNLNVRCLSYII